MSKSKKQILSLIMGLLSVILVSITLTKYIRYEKNNIRKEYTLFVYEDYTMNQILDTLESSGSLINAKSFEMASEKRELEKYIEPGRYELKIGMNNKEIIRKIANGWQEPMNISLIGYIRSKELLAGNLSRQMEADSIDFINVLNDKALMDSLGFKDETYIGMFIPNTYEMYWTDNPKKVILRFKKEYDNFWTEDRKAKAKKHKLSPIEVSILASIVVEESNYLPEQPIIAGVYLNRLRIGMRLQADPTVRYVALTAEPDLKRILNKHLEINSPYNTYINRGLPPGPITIPTISAIEAVLNPEQHKYLYFCAKPELDGTHYFAETYSQHLKNAREYHRKMNEMGLR